MCAAAATPAWPRPLGPLLVGQPEAWQRALGALLTAVLAAERELVEPADLPLALDARRMVLRQAADQVADAVADLQREVRRRGAHQLTDVLDGRLAPDPLCSLVLAHPRKSTR